MALLLLTRRLGLAALLALSLVACAGVFFQPEREHVRTPAQLGLAYEDVHLETADGVRLHGWFLPARAPACGTILFLHGNAENVSTHIGSVLWLPARGFNVFLPDYRGYGASAGAPSFPGLQADIDAALGHLTARPDVDPGAIALFGQSLGAAAAIAYVADSPRRAHIRALVAESPFASARDIAREKLASFWLTWPLQWPLAWTVPDGQAPIGAVERIAPIPLLLVHGDSDEVVGLHHSERLFARAQAPKEFWRMPGGGHIDAFRRAEPRERLTAYLRARLCSAARERGN